MLDALIIGAGAAGISAARRLKELGLTSRIIEAKPHIGGRTLTDTATFGVPVDLGAHWFHSPAKNPLRVLADELGHPYLRHALKERHAAGGRFLAELESSRLSEAVYAAFERFLPDANDLAASTFFAADVNQSWHPAFVAAFLAKQGVPLEKGSSLDFARYHWEGDDLAVTGGYGALIARLARGLDITLAAPVSHIDTTGRDCVRVTTPKGSLEAKAIIITVSTGVLAADAIKFVSPLPERTRAAIASLPMGNCNKLALKFKPGTFGTAKNEMLLPLGRPGEAIEIVLCEDGHDIAVTMFNGLHAAEIARAGEKAMRAMVLEVLAGLYGTKIKSAVEPAFVVADWDHDPFVRGYVSAAKPGEAEARARLAEPIDDRIQFAGEATSPHAMGDAHGAWLEGSKAAEVLDKYVSG